MKFNIISVGKCKDKHLTSLYNEYIKRLKPYVKTSILELAHGKGNVTDVKKQEAKSILSKIADNDFVIALDEKGLELSTSKFANEIKQRTLKGIVNYTFIIGGADGLDDEVRKRADMILSLSNLTYPHMLVRLVLTEQLYRITMLNNNHPYHREG